jgi:3-oxoacyl-[acyl-carrier-protein] synthase II
MTEDRVMITGAGIICSLGSHVPEVWDALISGKTGIGPIDEFDPSGFSCLLAAQVRPLDLSDLKIHPRDARIMDTPSYLLLKAALDAFRGARLEGTQIPREEIGFFAGMGMIDYDIEDLLPAVLKSLDATGGLDYSAFYSGGYTEVHPLWPLSMLNNIGFCQVGTNLDLQGENTVFSPHADSEWWRRRGQVVLDGRAQVVVRWRSEKVSPLVLRARLCRIRYSGAETALLVSLLMRKRTVLGKAPFLLPWADPLRARGEASLPMADGCS